MSAVHASRMCVCACAYVYLSVVFFALFILRGRELYLLRSSLCSNLSFYFVVHYSRALSPHSLRTWLYWSWPIWTLWRTRDTGGARRAGVCAHAGHFTRRTLVRLSIIMQRSVGWSMYQFPQRETEIPTNQVVAQRIRRGPSAYHR